jgi:putative aldouronate transport system permease protein
MTLTRSGAPKDDELSSARSKVTAIDYVLVLFFIVMIALTFLPMVNLIARSLSDANAIARMQVGLVPIGFHLDAYRLIFNDAAYVRALGFTAFLTLVCVIVSMTLTISTAFPLSYDNLKGSSIFVMIMLITIYFHVGIIPNFILYSHLGLINSFWVLVLPNALSVFNVIIMRSFFFGLPVSLRESAEVEGANPLQILVKIYLPLSTPVLATLSLFYAVGRWNGFTDALIFIQPSHRHLYPIQMLLYELINNLTNIEAAAQEGLGGMDFGGLTQSLIAATVMFATVPILMVYPWLQRYFISGATLGAVKE